MKSFTVRDFEDLTMIVLTDLIKEAQEQIPEPPKYENHDELLRDHLSAMLLPMGISLRGSATIQLVMGGKKYNKNGEVTCYNADLELDCQVMGKKGRPLEHVVRGLRNHVEAQQRHATPDMTRKQNRLFELQEKLGKYKEHAARFRLQYNGNTSDVNTIRINCRAFLLGKEK